MISFKDNFAAILERVKDGLRGMKTGCWGEDRGRFYKGGILSFRCIFHKRFTSFSYTIKFEHIKMRLNNISSTDYPTGYLLLILNNNVLFFLLLTTN